MSLSVMFMSGLDSHMALRLGSIHGKWVLTAECIQVRDVWSEGQ